MCGNIEGFVVNSPLSSATHAEGRGEGNRHPAHAGLKQVIQRAILHVQSSGKKEVTGANVLVAIFGEKDSHAVFFCSGRAFPVSTWWFSFRMASPRRPNRRLRAHHDRR